MRNRFGLRLLASLLIVIGCEIAGSDARAQSPPTKVDRVRVDLRIVIEEYATANKRYQQSQETLKTRAERSELRKKLLPPVRDAMRFVRWAEKNPKDELALQGLLLIINRGPFTPAAENAATALSKNHLDTKGNDFRQIVMAVHSTPPPIAEKCLRVYIEKSSVRETQATACWALALYKAQMLSWAQMLDGGPLLAEVVEKPMLPHLKELDQEEAFLEAESLLKRVMSEYKDMKLSGYKDIKLADLAKRDYLRMTREFKTLALGKAGPAIDGEDLFGNRMKLSDYRGKVVVLSFWSTGCIPCMKMIPRERALVAKYREQPFALLGVNTDQSRERAKAAVAKHKMTWPSWWDGKETGRGISKKWGLSFLPTIYVLDQKGIIRYKHVRGEHLTKAVDSLLQEIVK